MVHSQPLPVIQGGGNDSASISLIPDALMSSRDAALASLPQTVAVAPPVPLLTDNQLFAFADSAPADPFALTPYMPQSTSSPSNLHADVANTQSGSGGGVTSLVSFGASSAASPAPASGTMSPPPVIPPPSMPPVANSDIYAVGQGTFTVGASRGVLSNDTNPTGQPMSAVLVSTTTHGTLSLGTDGSLIYIASAGYTGGDSFTYKVTAGGLTSNTATDIFYVSNNPPPPPPNPPAFSWTQTPPLAPAITNPGSRTGLEGQPVSLAIQATGNGPLRYAALELPTGLSMNATTGVIAGTLTGTAGKDLGGHYTTTVIVSGADGGSATAQFAWVITPAPTLNSPGDQSNTAGDHIAVQLQASGPNGDTLAYSAVGLPTGLAVDATGLLSGRIDLGASGSSIVTATVTDLVTGATATQTFNWVITPATPPVSQPLTMNPIGDQTSAAGLPVDLVISAFSSNPISYSVAGLPSGLAINPTSGEITGTSPNSAFSATPYHVTVTATDSTSSVSQTFNWIVNPVGVADPGDQNSTVGDAISLPMTSHDATGGILNYTVVGLPPGLVIDPASGRIGGTLLVDPTGPGRYDVTVTASDGTYAGSQEFDWAVQAAPSAPGLPSYPIVVTSVAFPASEGIDTGFVNVATFTGNPNGGPSDYNATINWGDGTTDLGFVAGQGGAFTVSGGHTYTNSGMVPTSVIVTDANGNSVAGMGIESVTPARVSPLGGFQVGAVVGQSGELVTEFSYGNPLATASGFSAMIVPGDGSGPVMGTVSSLGGGLFGVSLPRGYAHSGPETATVTIMDPHGAQTVTSGTVQVGDIVAAESANLTVATFNVGNPNAQASSYSATINWGDGSTGIGTVTGSGGVFTVTGNHTYLVDSIDTPGGYRVTVTLSTPGQTALSASQNVVVTRPTLTGQIANVAVTATGLVAMQPIAAFEVPDITDTAAEFQATIDWGDGTTSAGTISGGNGLFAVAGGHQYTALADVVIRVTFGQSWSVLAPALARGARGQKNPPAPAMTPVTILPKTFGNYLDSLPKYWPKGADAIIRQGAYEDLFFGERQPGVALSAAQTKQRNENSYFVVVNKAKGGGFGVATASFVQFAYNSTGLTAKQLAARASFVQIVTQSVTVTTNGTDTVPQWSTLVEGWKADKGAANQMVSKGLDLHLQLNADDVKPGLISALALPAALFGPGVSEITTIYAFRVGTGTVFDKGITGKRKDDANNAASSSEPLAGFDQWKSAPMTSLKDQATWANKAVQWTAGEKPKSYQVVFTIKPDGTWTYLDSSFMAKPIAGKADGVLQTGK